MTPEQELRLADQAREVLENEAYQKAWESIREEVLIQWKNSPARDVEGREKLWLMHSLLQKLQSCLEATMAGGKLAKKELEHRRTILERARDFVSGNE